MNKCFDPDYLKLTVGLSFKILYDVSGSEGTGEQTIDAEINGPAVFEGQSRTQTTIKLDSAITASGETITLAVVNKDYQSSDGESITSYGSLSTGSTTAPFVGAINFASKSVETPPFVDGSYKLKLGESITQTETEVTTVTLPSPSGPNTSATVSTTRYVADETISVFGKSYSTCRYEVFDTSAPADITTTWYIVGNGIPAKIADSTSSLILQLKSGTYKGAPL